MIEPLVWMKGLPKKTGYYWFRPFGVRLCSIAQVADYYGDGREIRAYLQHGGGWVEVNHAGCEWAGPIPEPVEAT